jgi:hypothetical protein
VLFELLVLQTLEALVPQIRADPRCGGRRSISVGSGSSSASSHSSACHWQVKFRVR